MGEYIKAGLSVWAIQIVVSIIIILVWIVLSHLFNISIVDLKNPKDLISKLALIYIISVTAAFMSSNFFMKRLCNWTYA